VKLGVAASAVRVGDLLGESGGVAVGSRSSGRPPRWEQQQQQQH
jgi:hypothetical protein